MVPAGEARIVLSMATSMAEAQTIARGLVEERLAACVNVVPGACSIYHWRGEVHQDAEWMLFIKTVRANLPALEARLKALHSAEVPEMLVVVPESGSEDYLLWIDATLAKETH